MRNAEAVRELDGDLRTIFAGRMQSLVVYGAVGSPNGPVTTLAVVVGLSAGDLERCADRLATWRGRGLATPLLLEAGEFASSLDAFPFEFGAILADHELVSGTSPFAGLAVDPADLRRACEVQARSHLLHLREGYIETERRPDQIAELLTHSAPALAALLKNVARMPNAPQPGAMLTRIAELAHGGTISTDEASRLVPGYFDAMDNLARALDRWSTE